MGGQMRFNHDHDVEGIGKASMEACGWVRGIQAISVRR